MRTKTVLRYSPNERVFRVVRLMWERGVVGTGQGYSAKLSLALAPVLFRAHRTWDGWRVGLLGVQLHYKRSYGGIFT